MDINLIQKEVLESQVQEDGIYCFMINVLDVSFAQLRVRESLKQLEW